MAIFLIPDIRGAYDVGARAVGVPLEAAPTIPRRQSTGAISQQTFIVQRYTSKLILCQICYSSSS